MPALIGSRRAVHFGRAVVPAAAPTYVGPLDVVGSGVHSWTLRAASADFIGDPILEIVRASDSAVDGFVSLEDGSLDVASIAGFLAATTGKVSKVYDQPGGNHVVQATDAARPEFVFDGGHGLPCMRFAGAQELVGISNLSSIAATTQSAVAHRTGNFSSNGAILGSNGFDTLLFYPGAVDIVSIYAGTALGFLFALDVSWHAINGVYTAGGVGSSVTVDGVTQSGDIGSNTFGGTTTPPHIGNGAGAGFFLIGDVSEVEVRSINADGTQLANLDANQRAYWGF